LIDFFIINLYWLFLIFVWATVDASILVEQIVFNTSCARINFAAAFVAWLCTFSAYTVNRSLILRFATCTSALTILVENEVILARCACIDISYASLTILLATLATASATYSFFSSIADTTFRICIEDLYLRLAYCQAVVVLFIEAHVGFALGTTIGFIDAVLAFG